MLEHAHRTDFVGKVNDSLELAENRPIERTNVFLGCYEWMVGQVSVITQECRSCWGISDSSIQAQRRDVTSLYTRERLSIPLIPKIVRHCKQEPSFIQTTKTLLIPSKPIHVSRPTEGDIIPTGIHHDNRLAVLLKKHCKGACICHDKAVERR